MTGASMRIFLICPVRNIADAEKDMIAKYVDDQERAGNIVHWPLRDTDQDDSIGLRICTDNRRAIKNADEVHIWWNEASKGSYFDLGMTFALEKKVVVANPLAIARTPEKSFNNMLLEYVAHPS
jgi:hypothetical protein